MTGSVKYKIRAGSAFLFLLVMISGGLSLYFVVKFRLDSKNLFEANYQSIEYSHKMQQQLDSITNGNKLFADSFASTLQRQQVNVTEIGEADATKDLNDLFRQFRAGHQEMQAPIKLQLQKIANINLNAIKNKTARSEHAAEEAMTFLITIVSFIFIIGLTFVINFPSVITSPLQKLRESINEISRKNYSHRAHINSNDEFGEVADAFNDMAERIEHFESSNLNKIIFEKSRAEAVIKSLKDASIGIDKNDTVLFANDQALQLLNLSNEEIIGVTAGKVGERNDLFRFLLEERSNMPFKIVVDDRENYFLKETINISQEGLNSKVIVLKNITSFKELDVAKNNFIATISHELKTPLASSDISLKLLVDERIGTLSQEQKDLIHSLKLDNQRMLQILSELLNMAQVEAGKIIMNITQADPYRIADAAVEVAMAAGKEKGLQIKTAYSPGLSQVLADAEKTGWVLNNFLTNAIKHAPEESLVILQLRRENSQIVFSVRDEGKGIPAEYLSKVFDRFFRVPGSKAGGTGLGLAISKEFIEAESGSIWVKSEIGMGSEFGFSLPVAT